MSYKAGYVALIGKPNVGKSTLLNRIVGQKVSIVSNKPQTTRKRVMGISTTNEYQIAFIDTPGIHDAHTRLGKTMVDQARGALDSIALAIYVADGAHHPGEMDRQIASMIKSVRGDTPFPLMLCMNKMDLLKAEDVQRNLDAYLEMLGLAGDEYMMTTATDGTNVDLLVSKIVESLPERSPLYDEDEYTDQSSRFMAGEFVREKILKATRQEIPHSTAVIVEGWEESDKLVNISATIYVEKASQRGIIIGKQGQFLKQIGIDSRADIEQLIGKKVFLELHVKVSEDWRMNPRILQELDYSGE